MAHLLGSPNCLESLAVDICDVQEAIADIFARVGPVRFPSWKYPDKASCDLDMAELLARYCFSKDEDHTKLSHIILFELLIDRLVLLLQALSAFSNHLLSNTNHNRPGTAKAVGSAMSVGLVVKKFWNKMAHLYQIVQRELTESANKSIKVKGMEDTIADMKQEVTMLRDAVKNKSTKQSPVKGEIRNHSNSKTSAKFILSHTLDMNLESPSSSQDVTLSVEEVALTKTCKESTTQTYDTAFVPCEACSRTQENLIEVGKMVMKVCESQGLPSSLAKQKRLLKQSLLAAADVSRWAAEQNRDLSRINDHLDNLYAQIEPLQEKLSKSRVKRKVLEEQVKQLEEYIEVEKLEAEKNSENFSGKLNEVIEEKKELEEKSDGEIRELNKTREVLETRIEQTEEKLKKSTTVNTELELQHQQLTSDLKKEKLENNRLMDIEEDLDKTKVMLKEMQGTLGKTTLELGKMEAKNRSLVKHDKALQGKHDTLLQRIDELDQECEELRDRVMDLEGERDDLDESLSNTKNQSENLTKELEAKQQQLDVIETDRNNLAEAVHTLKDDVQRLHNELRENDERMTMMVSYPSDMDAGNIGHLGKDALDNPVVITLEMEKQISSNNIRIVMLEAQNKKLRHSIEKLSTVRQLPKTKQMDDPVLLWTSPNERPKSRNQNNSTHSKVTRSASDSQRPANHNTLNVSEGHRPRPPSGLKLEQKNSFQSSREKVFEKRQARVLSAKLASSGAHDISQTGNKQRGAMDRVHTVHDDASTTGYEPVSTFVCGACDKMYTTRKDLEIHKAFCYELQT